MGLLKRNRPRSKMKYNTQERNLFSFKISLKSNSHTFKHYFVMLITVRTKTVSIISGKIVRFLRKFHYLIPKFLLEKFKSQIIRKKPSKFFNKIICKLDTVRLILHHSCWVKSRRRKRSLENKEEKIQKKANGKMLAQKNKSFQKTTLHLKKEKARKQEQAIYHQRKICS